MVSRAEINAITIVAEEREHQKYLVARERVKEATRQYCSSTLSDQLRVEADKPSRCLVVKVTAPDKDGEVRLVVKDSTNDSFFSPDGDYYNLETLAEFVREHGFEVSIENGTYRYSTRTNYSCKNIYIRW